MPTLSEIVVEARKRKKISVADVARAASVSEEFVCLVEGGSTAEPIQDVFRICSALDIDEASALLALSNTRTAKYLNNLNKFKKKIDEDKAKMDSIRKSMEDKI